MPADYAPYHTFPEFDQGITDYMEGRYDNPYSDPKQGVAAQAWDPGSEYAMRVFGHLLPGLQVALIGRYGVLT
jgi:hypothetical protein